ncbi:helix-turn-helix domain-containing protein [Proteiniphilum sp. X52]|uniref:helix-turn-helix domain-containing protein n=1 Tax=Proteiniphilum sp. X52 TaxID=2382159 RepID=UPI000F0A436E|nr:XRE family transcriptional regulator [Proteiniphilum sp. X52]
MPAKQVTPESRAICLRFVRAYEELRYRGKVKTKTEFGRKIGMSASNLKRIEDNENNEPSINSILLLLETYNVNPDWLFFGKGDFIRK